MFSLLHRASLAFCWCAALGLSFSAQAQEGGPRSVRVFIWAFYASSPVQDDNGYRVTLESGTTPLRPSDPRRLYVVAQGYGPVQDRVDLGFVPMEPGKSYTVSLTGYPYLSSGTLFAAAPPGYYIEIDGQARNRLFQGADINNAVVRVLPKRNAPAQRAGTPTAIRTGKVNWAISLGRLKDGSSAGELALVDAAFWPAEDWPRLSTPAILSYESTSEAEMPVYREEGVIRQIWGNEAIVDIRSLSPGPGFEICFYTPGQQKEPLTQPRTFRGQPFVTYRVEPGDAVTSLKFTREFRPVTDPDETPGVSRREIATLARTGAWPNFEWTTRNWTLENSSAPVEMVETSTGTELARSSTTLLREPASTTPALRVRREHALRSGGGAYPWWEALVSETWGSGDHALESAFEYYDDIWDVGSYGFPKIVRLPGGGWQGFKYANVPVGGPNMEWIGVPLQQFGPHNQTAAIPPASFDWGAAAGAASAVNFSNDPFGFPTRAASVESKIGTRDVSRSTTAHTSGEGAMAEANGHALVRAETLDYASAAISERTITYYFKEDADEFFRRKIHSLVRPDGVKLAYAYQRGYWDGSTFRLTPNNGCDADFPETAVLGPIGTRLSVITGTVATGASVSRLDGYVLDPVCLVEGRSTLQTTIRDNRGIVMRTETRVWKDGGWDATPISKSDYSYDYIGRLIRVNEDEGVNSFSYDSDYGHDLLTSETDASGIELVYTYDVAGRLRSITRTAAATVVTAAVTTTFDYDAAGRVVKETISSPGQPETIVSRRAYDDAGRLVSVTPAGLGATTYRYEVSRYDAADALKRVTARAPDGGERIWTYQRDGQLVSVTGDGVAQHWSYGTDGEGRSWVEARLGSATSPRTATSYTDWLGRTVRTERPGFTGQPPLVAENFYNASGQLKRTSRAGDADVLYEYEDPFGALTRVGEHYGPGSSLSKNSMDRITDFSRGFEWSEGAWWAVSGTKTYPKDNSDAELTLANTKRRLSGLSSNLRGEERVTDVDRRITTTWLTVNRATREATVTTTRPNLDQPEVSRFVNGRPSSTTSHDGLTFRTGYDVLSRANTQTDPRTGTVTTHYYPGTSLVERASGIVSATGSYGNLTSYGYDNVGRVQMVVNARGDVTRFSYDKAGRVSRRWGNGSAPVEFGYDAYGKRRFMRTYRSGDPAANAPAGILGAWWDSTWPNSPPAGDQTEWIYDEPSGLLKSKIHNSGTGSGERRVDFEYNRRGQLSRRVWARLVNPAAGESAENPRIATTYQYYGDDGVADESPAGELRSIAYNDGTPGVTFAYNRSGTLAKVWDATSSSAADFREFVYHDLPVSSTYTPQHLRVDAIMLGSFYGGRVMTSRYDGVFRNAGFLLGTVDSLSADLEQKLSFNGAGRLESVDTERAGESAPPTRFSYGYLVNSRLVETLSTGSFRVTSRYESNRDLLESINSQWGSASRTRFDYTYNTYGQRATTAQSGDVFGDLGPIIAQHFYNGRGELVDSAAYLGSLSGPQLSGRHFSFRYDPIGNRTSASRTGEAAPEGFSANALNEYEGRQNSHASVAGTVANNGVAVALRSSDMELPVGRQGRYWAAQVPLRNEDGPAQSSVTVTATQPAAAPSGADVIQSETRPLWLPAATQVFVYDADGNLSDDSVWSYRWDAENRLVGMRSKLGVAFASLRLELTFKYDYLGRRVEKKVHHLDNAVADTSRRYLYDGWNLVAEFSWNSGTASLSVIRSFTWGLDTSGSLAPIGSNGALLQIADHAGGRSFLPTYDGNGNVVALLQRSDAAGASAGAAVAKYEYSPFGEVLRCEGEQAKLNPFRFATKFTDEETGLIYFGHRYYSPSLGRFISRDPIEEAGGLNLNAYAGNDGVNLADILGLDGETKTLASPLPPTVVTFLEPIRVPPNGDVSEGQVKQIAPATSAPTEASQQGGKNGSYRDVFLWDGQEFPLIGHVEPLRKGARLKYGDSVIEGGHIWTMLSHVELPLSHEASPGRFVYILDRDAGVVYEIDRFGPPLRDGDSQLLDRQIERAFVVASLVPGARMRMSIQAARSGTAVVAVVDSAPARTAAAVASEGAAPVAGDLVQVFKGIHPRHPGHSEALKGKVDPRGGHSDPDLHNAGNNKSVFTSWTTHREVAVDYATGKYSGFNEPGGVVLEQWVSRSELVKSLDVFQEFEVLRVGPVRGAKSVIITR